MAKVAKTDVNPPTVYFAPVMDSVAPGQTEQGFAAVTRPMKGWRVTALARSASKDLPILGATIRQGGASAMSTMRESTAKPALRTTMGSRARNRALVERLAMAR